MVLFPGLDFLSRWAKVRIAGRMTSVVAQRHRQSCVERRGEGQGRRLSLNHSNQNLGSVFFVKVMHTTAIKIPVDLCI